MSIIFAASEVGSVMALVPLCDYFAKKKIPCSVIEYGYFTQIHDDTIHDMLITCPDTDTDMEIEKWLHKIDATAVIFSVNIKDLLPLKIARAASTLGLPTIHVLDYWNAYYARMVLDGLKVFIPTVYAVPDNYAAIMAEREGIQPGVISITGQPAFTGSKLSDTDLNKEKLGKILGLNPDNKWIMFVAEPVSSDQGKSLKDNADYRGYIEDDALSILIKALKQSDNKSTVCVMPHPRQDVKQFKKLWEQLGGLEVGSVVENYHSRDLLPNVVGVAGMASTLLYEAWLLGMPVASIQPGLRRQSLRMLENRADVTFIDSHEGATGKITQWVNELESGVVYNPRDEMQWHEAAPENIFQLVNKHLKDL